MRIGIDLVSVERVRESLGAHGERYTAFLFSERELADCTTERGIDVERLAARFAAKEAAIKALAPPAQGVQLKSVEIRRSDAGSLELALSGDAHKLAVSAGLSDFAVSVTHEEGFACAVVIAS